MINISHWSGLDKKGKKKTANKKRIKTTWNYITRRINYMGWLAVSSLSSLRGSASRGYTLVSRIYWHKIKEKEKKKGFISWGKEVKKKNKLQVYWWIPDINHHFAIVLWKILSLFSYLSPSPLLSISFHHMISDDMQSEGIHHKQYIKRREHERQVTNNWILKWKNILEESF